jgi:hypothetical protein
MAEAVYLLCASTCLVCAILLLRGYRRSRARLLFWTGICFAGLTLNNFLLFADLVVLAAVDLSIVRGVMAYVALSALVFGLVTEDQR